MHEDDPPHDDPPTGAEDATEGRADGPDAAPREGSGAVDEARGVYDIPTDLVPDLDAIDAWSADAESTDEPDADPVDEPVPPPADDRDDGAAAPDDLQAQHDAPAGEESEAARAPADDGSPAAEADGADPESVNADAERAQPAPTAPADIAVEPPESEPTVQTPTAMQIDLEHETVDLEDPDGDDFDPDDYLPDPLVGSIPWQEAHTGPLRIAIAGGRGGVGRTLFAASVALILSRLGHRCVLVDLDPVGAGLHTAVGLPPHLPGPRRPGVPAMPDPEKIAESRALLLRPARALAGPADPHRLDLLSAAERLDTDVLVFDLGAQPDGLTLDTWTAADLSVTLAAPNPAAVERCYGFVGAALWRRILHGDDGPSRAARALLDAAPRVQTPLDLVAALAEDDPDAARAIRARIMTFTPYLVTNRTRTRVDREMGPAMVSALRRRWGVSAAWVAAIDEDEAARDAARRRRSMVLTYPGASYSQAIDKIAPRLFEIAGEGR